MRKTVYCVTYNGIGYVAPKTAVFASQREANDFYNNREYADKPKTKTYSKDTADILVALTEEELYLAQYECDAWE